MQTDQSSKKMKKITSIFLALIFSFNTAFSLWADENQLPPHWDEKVAGAAYDFFVTESFVILRNEKVTCDIALIAEKLAIASGSSSLGYEVKVINDTLPLAFSSPGGYIYVSTGLLDILKNKEELAAVLSWAISRMLKNYEYQTGREVSNQITKSRERSATIEKWVKPLGLGVVIAAPIAGAIVAGGALVGVTAGVVVGGAGAGAIYATGGTIDLLQRKSFAERNVFMNRMLPRLGDGSVIAYFREIYDGYSAKQELDADKAVLTYLKSAGYNPQVYIEVLQKLSELKKEYLSRGYVSALFIAQPGLEKRIENVRQIIEKK